MTITSDTLWEAINEEFPNPDGALDDNVTTIALQRFKMLKDYSTWYACLNCRKMLTEVSSTDQNPKCANCKAFMAIGSCPRQASIRVAVPNEDDTGDVWLTIFTGELSQLLNHYNEGTEEQRHVTLFHSSEKDISIALLNIQCRIVYDNETKIVKSLEFD